MARTKIEKQFVGQMANGVGDPQFRSFFHFLFSPIFRFTEAFFGRFPHKPDSETGFGGNATANGKFGFFAMLGSFLGFPFRLFFRFVRFLFGLFGGRFDGQAGFDDAATSSAGDGFFAQFRSFFHFLFNPIFRFTEALFGRFHHKSDSETGFGGNTTASGKFGFFAMLGSFLGFPFRLFFRFVRFLFGLFGGRFDGQAGFDDAATSSAGNGFFAKFRSFFSLILSPFFWVARLFLKLFTGFDQAKSLQEVRPEEKAANDGFSAGEQGVFCSEVGVTGGLDPHSTGQKAAPFRQFRGRSLPTVLVAIAVSLVAAGTPEISLAKPAAGGYTPCPSCGAARTPHHQTVDPAAVAALPRMEIENCHLNCSHAHGHTPLQLLTACWILPSGSTSGSSMRDASTPHLRSIASSTAGDALATPSSGKHWLTT